MRSPRTLLVVVSLVLGCAQEHVSPCPELAEALAAQEMYLARSCARSLACYRDGGYSTIGCGRLPDAGDLCDALASGRTIFHPERVAECEAELAACEGAPCFERVTPPLDRVLRPPRCTFDVCSGLLEASPTARCNAGGCGAGRGTCVAVDDACGGECMAAPLGGACSDVLPCADRLRCQDGVCVDSCRDDVDCIHAQHIDEIGTCEAGRCNFVAGPIEGEPCVRAYGDWLCGEGYCHALTHVCTPPASAGEPCDVRGGPGACEGLFVCSSSGVCAPGPFCDWSSGCLADAPYCLADYRTCSADPTAQACQVVLLVWSGYDECPDGYACVGDARIPTTDHGTCRPIAPLGAPCDASVSCAPGSSCAGGRCTPVVGFGMPCDASVSCGEDLACVDGVCDERLHWVGDACASGAECFTGRCVAGACAFAPPGEPCDVASTLSYFECEYGCRRDASDVWRCAAGQDHLGIGAACDTTHFCDEGLTCLARPDGTAACHPACAP